MKYRIILASILFSFAAKNSFALLLFPQGTILVEGKLVVKEKSVFLLVNYQSSSQSQIKLNGKLPKELFSQNDSNAAVKLNIKKKTDLPRIEADFLSLDHFLGPTVVPKVYDVVPMP